MPLKFLPLVLYFTYICTVGSAAAEDDIKSGNPPATELQAATVSTDSAARMVTDVEADSDTPGAEFKTAISNTGTPISKDVVLVLDNSGSMKKNDPQFLTSKAVTGFISKLDEATQISIVIFDQDVNLAVPLTRISNDTREQVLKSLSKVNYKGLYTDSPAAIERAIYELKNNGRDEAQKLIVFMTDGIVDTGNADIDLEKRKWLKEDLAPDAADSGIRIFGIAFTEAADFQLIQSIAQKTDGEYYRALQAGDLDNVFKRINVIINQPPEPEPEPETAGIPEPEVKEPAPAPPPQSVIIEMPAQPLVGKEERIRSIIILFAAIILILALMAIVVLLIRRNRDIKAATPDYEVEAYLNDNQGYTSQAVYKLGGKPVMIGRVAGKDTLHLDYIVIPQSTIGRRHALIDYKDYAYWISDQGSINGTFVNDRPVSSEIRLKHGDTVRFHKYEFEFVMPEVEDAGKTVIANTGVGNQGIDLADEAASLRGAEGEFSLDLDFTDEAEQPPAADQATSEAATIIPGADEDETLMPSSDFDSGQQNEEVLDDETLMPSKDAFTPEEAESEDETLMPGSFETDKNVPQDDASAYENFFDLDSEDDKK